MDVLKSVLSSGFEYQELLGRGVNRKCKNIHRLSRRLEFVFTAAALCQSHPTFALIHSHMIAKHIAASRKHCFYKACRTKVAFTLRSDLFCRGFLSNFDVPVASPQCASPCLHANPLNDNHVRFTNTASLRHRKRRGPRPTDKEAEESKTGEESDPACLDTARVVGSPETERRRCNGGQ